MSSEAARVWRLPVMLLVVLVLGCTTKVINLAVDGGGAEKPNVGREDARVDRQDAQVDREDVSVAIEDAGMDRDDAEDASSAHLKEAYDAGMVTGPGNYVQFTCCLIADAEVVASTCTSVWLGGPEVCYSASQWKDRAYSHCTSVFGSSLQDYAVFGAC